MHGQQNVKKAAYIFWLLMWSLSGMWYEE